MPFLNWTYHVSSFVNCDTNWLIFPDFNKLDLILWTERKGSVQISKMYDA